MRSDRRGRHEPRRRLPLALTSVAATALFAAVASADGPAATAPADAGARAAAATVTTWTSGDLAQVKHLGVRGTALRACRCSSPAR